MDKQITLNEEQTEMLVRYVNRARAEAESAWARLRELEMMLTDVRTGSVADPDKRMSLREHIDKRDREGTLPR